MQGRGRDLSDFHFQAPSGEKKERKEPVPEDWNLCKGPVQVVAISSADWRRIRCLRPHTIVPELRRIPMALPFFDVTWGNAEFTTLEARSRRMEFSDLATFVHFTLGVMNSHLMTEQETPTG